MDRHDGAPRDRWRTRGAPSRQTSPAMRPRTSLLEMRFASDPRRLKRVRERVLHAAEKCGCTRKIAADLVLAVNEACMNIMQHAYKGDPQGEIVLEIRRVGGELEVRLIDYATPVDPKDIKPRPLDELRPGGLGTFFIRELVDDCEYGHLQDEAGNFVCMRKKIN